MSRVAPRLGQGWDNHAGVALSFLYLSFRALQGALVRGCRCLDVKDIELLVRRHEFQPPQPHQLPLTAPFGEIRRRERLGGIIHEHYRGAA